MTEEQTPDPSQEPQKKIKKRRAKRKSNPDRLYFNSNTQAAIVKFQSTVENKERNRLYNEEIRPAFDKLVENLVNIHKFTSLHDSVSDLRNDCVEYLFETIKKFDSNRGTNAFSYFNVVAKNFLIVKVKQRSNNARKYVSLDNVAALTTNELKCMQLRSTVSCSFLDDRERDETKKLVHDRFAVVKEALESKQEKSIVDAVTNLIRSADDIDIVSKQAVMVYVKEMTGLSSKHVSIGLSKIKRLYVGICMHHPTLGEKYA